LVNRGAQAVAFDLFGHANEQLQKPITFAGKPRRVEAKPNRERLSHEGTELHCKHTLAIASTISALDEAGAPVCAQLLHECLDFDDAYAIRLGVGAPYNAADVAIALFHQ
jgi:hypothetical protein